jgi:NhaA family Na+:H+ antiporter
LNWQKVTAKGFYLFIGLVMWVAMLKSGVHATLTGVLLAMFIPLNTGDSDAGSPLQELEHDLHPFVGFFILPLFAFANAGISMGGVGVEHFLSSVPLGIALGLIIGKQVGVFGFCWLAVRSGLGQLPPGMTMKGLYGTAALCGVGFTMSLFIGSLAFEETEVNLLFDERLGIICGSLISGVSGYLLLFFHLSAPQKDK